MCALFATVSSEPSMLPATSQAPREHVLSEYQACAGCWAMHGLLVRGEARVI